nr:hypothetical protein [Deltaproteobacteria bacterium]
YIAAQLNVANGAAMPASVQTSFDAATAMLSSYTPAQAKALKNTNADKAKFTTLGFYLDQYNQGVTGPGHCSE